MLKVNKCDYKWKIAENDENGQKSGLCDVIMTSKLNFSDNFFFSKSLSKNFQQHRLGRFLLSCDYLGQNFQKHVFWSIFPIP